MTLSAKIFFASLLLVWSQILLAEVKLTDDTNPKDLMECIDKIDILPGGSLSGEQQQKVSECINRDYAPGNQPKNLACRTKANLVDEKNLKNELIEVCNKKYYQTIPCLATGRKLKNKKTVQECILNNARYFVGDFCINYLIEVGMQTDQSLVLVCAEKKREEKVDTKEGTNL